jgi:hypothetical protein
MCDSEMQNRTVSSSVSPVKLIEAFSEANAKKHWKFGRVNTA